MVHPSLLDCFPDIPSRIGSNMGGNGREGMRRFFLPSAKKGFSFYYSVSVKGSGLPIEYVVNPVLGSNKYLHLFPGSRPLTELTIERIEKVFYEQVKATLSLGLELLPKSV